MSTNIIPTDGVSVFEVLRKLSTNAQQMALVRPNNPPPGIAGFLFDIVGDDIVELSSDITDHYTEENLAIQDQIGLRPEKVTVRGFVAELVLTPDANQETNASPNPLPTNLAMTPEPTPGAVVQKFQSVGTAQSSVASSADSTTGSAGVAPAAPTPLQASNTMDAAVKSLSSPASIAALQAPGVKPASVQAPLNVVSRVGSPSQVKSLGSAIQGGNAGAIGASLALLSTQTQDQSSKPATPEDNSLYGVYNRISGQQPNQTKQTKVFLYFYALWQARQLVSVETPWGIFNNMAIENCRPEQDEVTRTVTHFTITFKKIRVAQVVTTNVGQLAGRLAMQKADVSQNGNAGTAQVTPAVQQSLLLKIAPFLGGTP